MGVAGMNSLKRTAICAGIMAALAAGASAQTGTAADANSSPTQSHLAESISVYANQQCSAKTGADADDCRAKALWDASQCPPVQAGAAGSSCTPASGGFEYEVASIKQHDEATSGRNISYNTSADAIDIRNMTMRDILMNAFSAGLKIEIKDAPGWTSELSYDLTGKFDPAIGDELKKLRSEDQAFLRRYMLQKLLADRTGLKVRIDSKDVPAYDLVIGKDGPKMKPSAPDAVESGGMTMRPDRGAMLMIADGLAMRNFVSYLSFPAGRPVFDKTGLAGLYEIRLRFTPEQSLSISATTGAAVSPAGAAEALPTAPPLVDAMGDLGLKLVPSRGPMNVIVILHIEKPGAN
jgi:bla regulator protein blaR1